MIISIAFLVVLLLAVVDGAGSAVMLIFTLLIGMLICMTLPQKQRSSGLNLLAVIFSIYVSVAYIVSLSFSRSESFYVSDSMRYIESYIRRTTFFYSQQDFYDCYFHFSDTNLLFNAYLNEMAIIMNKYLGGMTVFGMTLCLTMFGVFSSIIMYRIFLRHFEEKYAFRSVLLFSLCSPFFLYSTVIIRDIVICFLYLVAFDIIDRKFSVKGLLALFVVMLLAWGVRLYSGIFVGVFIWYYIYVNIRTTSFKVLGTVFSVLIGIIAIVAVLGSALLEQTTEELMKYEEMSMERSEGGFVSRLMSLPPGISNICIVLFTMIRPLPPFSVYEGVASFSNFTISSLALLSGFFWFVSFYTFVLLIIFNRQLKKMSFEKILLLGISLLFLLVNAAHPDVRRMLPVFPVLYLLLTYGLKDPVNAKAGVTYKKVLVTCYVVAAFALLAV